MSSRRELFLEEIGLTPLWRLKSRDAGMRAEAAQQGRSVPVAAMPAVAAKPAAPRPAMGADDRAGRIARMDWPELKATVAACAACLPAVLVATSASTA